MNIEWEDEWELERRWVDARDAAEDAAHRARCEGCEDCEEPEECGWCGEVDCADPACAELTATLEALRAARTPVCLGCAVRVGGVYTSPTYRMARPGEKCGHADHVLARDT